jgi:hypothetical protein
MSCPDWRGFADQRAGDADREPAGWSDAVDHFAGGCRLCRKDALTADPTLVFHQRMGTPVEMSPAHEAAEVDAVRQAVAAMRTASRVAGRADYRSRRALGTIGSFGTIGWKRWAVAAGLALAALSIPADNARRAHDQPASQLASLGDLPAQRAPITAFSRGTVLPAAFAGMGAGGGEADLPTVEGVDRPGARVYHMDGEGLSVVMIVDESLDV